MSAITSSSGGSSTPTSSIAYRSRIAAITSGDLPPFESAGVPWAARPPAPCRTAPGRRHLLLLGELQRDHLVAAESIDNPAQRTVVVDLSLGDDHDALAERRHVFHVVAGQQDRDLPLLLVVLEELLDVVLSHHVQTDRRLVQKQHLRRMQQGGDQLHLHPLAQRQLAHRLLQQSPHVQQGRSARPASV